MVGTVVANSENASWQSHDKIERRPHLNSLEDDGRHVGKRAPGVQGRLRAAGSTVAAYGAHRQLSENVWFVFKPLDKYNWPKLVRYFSDCPLKLKRHFLFLKCNEKTVRTDRLGICDSRSLHARETSPWVRSDHIDAVIPEGMLGASAVPCAVLIPNGYIFVRDHPEMSWLMII